MSKWLKPIYLYAAIGAFFGATTVGIQMGLEKGLWAGIRWAGIGAIGGAIVFVVIAAVRSYDRTRESQAAAQAIQPTGSIQPLSSWNPIDHLRFLWWLFMNPSFLQAYRVQVGESNTRQMGAWSASVLLWLPLFSSGLAGALKSDNPIEFLLIGGLFLLVALFITCVVGTPKELNVDRQDGMGGISLFMIEGFVFMVAAVTAIGITGVVSDHRPLSTILVIAFGVASGSAIGVADSVWEVRPHDVSDKLTKLVNVVSLIHTFTVFIIAIGITVGTALAFAIATQPASMDMVASLIVIGFITAAVPAISLAFVADIVAKVLQRSVSVRFSFGRLARWFVLVMLVLSQVVPVWVVALRGWPLF